MSRLNSPKWHRILSSYLPGGALDAVILLLFFLLFRGGISVQGKLLLKHGPDLRRAILLLLVFSYALDGLRRTKRQVALGGNTTTPDLSPLSRAPAVFPASLFGWLTHLLIQFLRTPRNRYLVLGGWTLFAVATSVAQALALEYTQYDVGIFHQVLWSLSQGMGPWSSISRAGNFWMDHLALSLVLFVPFFKVAGSHPLFLPILNPLLLYGGLAAWLICTDRALATTERLSEQTSRLQFREVFGIVALGAVVTFDSVWLNRGWGFHENTIAFFFGSWGIALLLFTPRSTPINRGVALGCLLVAALSKEILLVDYALALGVWAALESDRRLRALLAGFALSCVLLFIWFELQPHPADKNYFVRYYGYLGTSLPQFAKTLLLEPSRVVEAIGGRALRTYFWEVFKYWLILPVIVLAVTAWRSKRLALKPNDECSSHTRAGISKGPQTPIASTPKLSAAFLDFPALWLLPILPSLASCALSTYPPLRWIRFHYVLELWPFLFAVSLAVLLRLQSRTGVVIWGLWMAFQWNASPFSDFAAVLANAVTRKPVLEAIESIGKHAPIASIAAIEEVGPWLASRKLIARYPDLDLIPNACPDWIIVRETIELNAPLLETRLKRCGWSAPAQPLSASDTSGTSSTFGTSGLPPGSISGQGTAPSTRTATDPWLLLQDSRPFKIQEWIFYRLPSVQPK